MGGDYTVATVKGAKTMSADNVFAGPVPQLYDLHLGPILFQPYAEAIAGRLTPSDRAILETAAGTGIVTRAMAAALPASRIVATDLNQAMLDVAAAKPQAGKAADITWQQADAQTLPFADGSFDVVACSFGMMFMPDKPAAFGEARRVLQPGGRMLFTVWDRIETSPVMHVVEEAVAALFPDDPPRFLSRTPCGYRDAARIEQDLRAAGFTRVEIETLAAETEVDSPSSPAMGLTQGTPLRGEIEARDPARLPAATDAALKALTARFGSGSFRSPLQALLVTAS